MQLVAITISTTRESTTVAPLHLINVTACPGWTIEHAAVISTR